MKGALAMAAVAVAAAVTATTAVAQTGPASVYTRDTKVVPTEQRVFLGYQDQFITIRPVLAPEVVVPREVYETPTHPYLIELTYGNATTIYVDPLVDYVNRDIGPGRIDDNHSLLRAQRTWIALNSPGARVIGPLRPRPADQNVGEKTRFVPIFRIPIPETPRPEKNTRPVAAAD